MLNAIVKMLQVAPGALTLMLLGMPAWAAQAPAGEPPVRHQLIVTLNPEQHELSAVDTITLNGVGAPLVEFRLSDRISISSVKIDGAERPFSFEDGLLRIDLPETRKTSRLQIAYAGRFDDPVPEQPLNTDNPGFGVTGTIQPQGTMLLGGAGWYPENHAWASRYDLTVIAPRGMVAVTTGTSLGHTTERGRTLSHWRVDEPVRAMSLVAGPYRVTTRTFGHVTAATYFTESLQHLSEAYLEATGRYLQLYEGLFGPYAFGQFAVVENFFPTGYGFPSFTLMGGRVLQLPFIIHTSLGHEIAHCWWGNGVLVDPSQGNWCEGLTTYVADYLYQERQGKGMERRLLWLRNYANLVDANHDFPLSRFEGRTDPATMTVGYDKGAMVFHMLRQTVGDHNFWQTLRDIYARYRFQAITWSDIQTAFEEHSGLRLQNFFQQWVFRPGAPRLALSDVSVQPSEQGFTVHGSISQRPPYFDLKLELVLDEDDRPVRQTLSLSGDRTFFSMAAAGRPRQLAVDPDYQIFRRLSPGELPPTINTLKGSADVRVVVSRDEGAEGLDTARRLALSLGLEGASITAFVKRIFPCSITPSTTIV